jgi:nucleoside-diphosphate-sugar epimerase
LSINELAAHAIAAFGHPPVGYQIVRKPGRPGEQRAVRADIGLAKSILGWEPKTPFETGLARTIAWARTEFAADPSAASFAGAAR